VLKYWSAGVLALHHYSTTPVLQLFRASLTIFRGRRCNTPLLDEPV
jgi:hypothetical protein